ncbi:DUF459 domain-containing protein [Suttonella indologenes]|uniref:Protein of uncharacterized function (DUF459) n=1 Tax=Suttonella indologenes TaxID=13276 RepID=A0A380MUE4_9GAMM|nr:DUF459 domain-containing protein [Suttonella indologenes]SUO96220.1 Protein of uncharacterised function (DUF459) [Suttonella indologenes]
MPTSNTRLSVFIALSLSALFCIWFSQQSINRYWQQTYHRPSPLASLDYFALWRAGANLQNTANTLAQGLRSQIQAIDQRIAAQQSPPTTGPNVALLQEDFTLSEAELREATEALAEQIEETSITDTQTEHSHPADDSKAAAENLVQTTAENDNAAAPSEDAALMANTETPPSNDSGDSKAAVEDPVQTKAENDKTFAPSEDAPLMANTETSPTNDSGETKVAVENSAQTKIENNNATAPSEDAALMANTETPPSNDSGDSKAAVEDPVQTKAENDKTATPSEDAPLMANTETSPTNDSGETKAAVENSAQIKIENNNATAASEDAALMANTETPPSNDSGETKATVQTAAANDSTNTQTEAAPQNKALLEQIPLQAGDKVLLIGDSLMQGVAPFVQQTLQRQYNINSINLSKQSTGLSYPDFFNWPAEVEKTLAADKSIKAVVVFLGPNDPWDFPDPEQGSKAPYLKFKSKAWEAVYRARISRIVESAQKHDAGVIWLGLPFMKPEKLNEQMLYLDGIMRSEMRDKGIFVPTKYILTGGAPTYVDTIMLEGKSVRVRSKDGIHFTPTGQRQIAIAIMRRLHMQTEN